MDRDDRPPPDLRNPWWRAALRTSLPVVGAVLGLVVGIVCAGWMLTLREPLLLSPPQRGGEPFAPSVRIAVALLDCRAALAAMVGSAILGGLGGAVAARRLRPRPT